MKLSLISATSIFALAASGHACAYVLTRAPGETNLYDLVHDEDAAVAAPDRLAIAAAALQATKAGRKGAEQADRSAGTGFLLVPLGAAPGTPPDDDFATQLSGTWHWNASQKALAIGVARIAPLIGTIGNGSSPDGKPGSTVLIAQSSRSGFGGGSPSGSGRRSASADGFAASSTSTATMTVIGPPSARERAGSEFAVAAPNDAQPMPPASEAPPTEPVPTYQYAPQTSPGAQGNLATASFGSAVTATGATTLVYRPVVPANSHAGPGRPNSLPNSEQAATYARLIDVTLPIAGSLGPGGVDPIWAGASPADGTRTFLPASVSANPADTAARYVISVLDAAFSNQAGQTAEMFQIGPTKAADSPTGASATVANPLSDKIVAGVGPLDNSLALP
jgi:hypothetical protein